MSDDRKLSALPPAQTLNGSDLLLVVNEGASRRTSLSNVVGYFSDGLAKTSQVNASITELETSISGALAQKQPLDADLTSIAGLSTASFGRSLLTMNDAAATKAALEIAAADVSGLAGAADGRIAIQKGSALGVAPLDAAGKVPSAHLPAQGVTAFNTRSGAVTLTGSDVTTALGFSPAGLNTPAFTAPSLGTASATSLNFPAAGGGAKVTLTGATSNWIEWNGAGVAAPTLTTRSAGTKLVLYPAISASQADYALGVEGSFQWSSVPTAGVSYQGWKWYGGGVEAARLTAGGGLTVIDVSAVTASFSGNDHSFGSSSGRLNLKKQAQAEDAGLRLYTDNALRWNLGEMGSSVGNTGMFYIHRQGVGICLSIDPSNRAAAFGADVTVGRYLSVLGGSIFFPPTQAPSSDPNALDDYKEASWTPTLTFGGSGTGNVYTFQLGTYTKIGRLVYLSAYIVLQTKGSATGEAAISGLPFSNAGRGVASIGVRLNPSLPDLWGNCGQGGNTIPIYSGQTPTTHASFASGCEINVTLVFSV